MSTGRYAVLGDIHANWQALEAVLEDAQKQRVTHFVSVGDLVGYNASPGECLKKIWELPCVTVQGNHDHYCANAEPLLDFHPLARQVVDWTRQQLTPDQVAFLRSCRLWRTVGGFTLVHSTLDMPDRWGYVFDTLEAEAHFNYQTTTVCFHGHTHIPVIFEKHGSVARHPPDRTIIMTGRKYFINVGSVGQPRDGDWRACYCVYDPSERELVFRRVPYDVETAQEKIRQAGLPERLALRLRLGK